MEAIEGRARALLIDYLVVEARGSRSAAATAAQYALSEPGDEAVVGGTRQRASLPTAALLNGLAAHSIELDDTYEPASSHPGVAVWPAVLAVAESTSASLDAAVRAAIVGYDAACWAGDRLDPNETYSRGFHPTGVTGPVGAAAAVATLLDLSPRRIEDAQAIATSGAGGLLAFLDDGAWTKPLHAGQAAATGLRAAMLAQAGFRAPAGAFNGPHGLFHAFGGRVTTPARRAHGDGVMRTSTKPFPCCRYAHPSIDALLTLRRVHGFDGADIAAINCAVLEAGARLIADPPATKLQIHDQVDGQFSMPFLAALAVERGEVTLDDLERAPEIAPGMAELMASVSCIRSNAIEAEFPDRWGADVAVTLRDGSSLRQTSTSAPGSPERPATAEDLRAKAEALLGPAGSVLVTKWLEAGPETKVAALRSGVLVGAAV